MPTSSIQEQKSFGGISKSYATGLCFILSVSIIWAASSVLIQYIYTDTHNTFHSPFLVTYIGVSLFTLWLPTHHCCWISSCITKRFGSETSYKRSIASNNNVTTSTIQYETIPLDNDISMEIDSSVDDTTIDDENNVETQQQQQQQQDGSINDSITGVLTESAASDSIIWTEYDHIRTAMYIAPVWFFANWSYNASLIYTTITSSTVLSSTGSLFTYIFAICTNDEQLTVMKLIGVLSGVLGSFITTLSDTTPNEPKITTNAPETSSNDDFSYSLIQQHLDVSSSSSSSSSSTVLPMLGDILGLLSAVGYGTYAVQTRLFCPKDESLYSMQLLLGYIGLWNMILLSPITIYLLISGQANLSWMILGFLTFKGLFDNVLSDYLWLRAVMLTNATTATVGLGCTIPLAFVSDVMLGKENGVISTEQIVGAITVLIGFVLVNIGNTTTTTSEHVNTRTSHTHDHRNNNFSDRLQQQDSSYHDENI